MAVSKDRKEELKRTKQPQKPRLKAKTSQKLENKKTWPHSYNLGKQKRLSGKAQEFKQSKIDERP